MTEPAPRAVLHTYLARPDHQIGRSDTNNAGERHVLKLWISYQALLTRRRYLEKRQIWAENKYSEPPHEQVTSHVNEVSLMSPSIQGPSRLFRLLYSTSPDVVGNNLNTIDMITK
jgi:hypothetical protein